MKARYILAGLAAAAVLGSAALPLALANPTMPQDSPVAQASIPAPELGFGPGHPVSPESGPGRNAQDCPNCPSQCAGDCPNRLPDCTQDRDRAQLADGTGPHHDSALPTGSQHRHGHR